MAPPTSLYKDKNDGTALHSPAWRLDEEVNIKRINRHVPFFFTRSGASVPLEGLYQGASVFLLAGGPSVKNLNLGPLKKAWVMNLNNSAKTFRGEANCIVDDPSRFSMSTWLDPKILKFTPMSHFEKPLWDNRMLIQHDRRVQKWELSKLKVGDCPNVVGFRRNEKFHAPRWLHEETINWGNHGKFGGGRSVLLAALKILFLLGFRRVFLLGVDFDMSETSRYHFDEERPPAAVRGNMETYAKLAVWFMELQPLFLKEGFHVFNCNANSQLSAFPFISFETAVEVATSSLGSYSQERTNGMYIELGKKIEACSA